MLSYSPNTPGHPSVLQRNQCVYFCFPESHRVRRRAAPLFAWSLLEAAGLSDLQQQQDDSEGETFRKIDKKHTYTYIRLSTSLKETYAGKKNPKIFVKKSNFTRPLCFSAHPHKAKANCSLINLYSCCTNSRYNCITYSRSVSLTSQNCLVYFQSD